MGSKLASTINSCVTLHRSLNLSELFLSYCTSGLGVGVGESQSYEVGGTQAEQNIWGW